MNQEDLSELSDQELLAEAKKYKSTSIINALLIGVMAGIIIYSIVKDTVSLFTFIPLVFIIKIVKDSKNNQQLEQLLKERNLK